MSLVGLALVILGLLAAFGLGVKAGQGQSLKLVLPKKAQSPIIETDESRARMIREARMAEIERQKKDAGLE